MKSDIKQDKAMAKKAVGIHEKQLHGGKKSDMSKLKKGGKIMKYAEGGSPTAIKPEKKKSVPPEVVPPFAKDQNQDTKNQKAAEQYQKTRKFAKGGGIETKGKTKGRMV